MIARRVAAWLVHVYTASSAVIAFLALVAALDGRLRDGFLWLALQVAVDASDGWLARKANVARHASSIDGGRLDDIVDYLTYVFVPAAIVWHVPLVPPGFTVAVPAAMLLASAFGFAQRDAKTSDHFFTGFPSYWNVVTLYLVALPVSPPVAAVILLGLAVLVFVPLRYVYPSRTDTLRWLTVSLGVVWGGLTLLMIWRLPDAPRPLVLASLVFPIYYIALSLVLDARRRTAR